MLSIHIQSIYILTHGTLKSSVPIISGSEPKKKLLSMLSGPLASLGRIRHCAPASCPPSFRSNTEHEAVRRRLALFHGRVLLPPFPSPPLQPNTPDPHPVSGERASPGHAQLLRYWERAPRRHRPWRRATPTSPPATSLAPSPYRRNPYSPIAVSRFVRASR